MELSNFVLIRTEGSSVLDYRFFAEVDVETGFLFWKKKERKQIAKDYAQYWVFVDTGKYTPGLQAEELAKSYALKTGNRFL